MQEAGLSRISPNLVRVTIFVAIAIAYIATAPGYHTTAIDSYNFATIISEHEPFQVPARLFLWLSSMQGLYWLVSLVTTNADPFQVVGYANAIQAALSVVVLQLLLRRHFDVPARAAWLTALIFGTSYGTWRYATELEVYASAILFSVILLLLAFSLDTAQSPARLRQIAAIAGAGALASIFLPTAWHHRGYRYSGVFSRRATNLRHHSVLRPLWADAGGQFVSDAVSKDAYDDRIFTFRA